ncbi:MAG: hypothetical protein WBE76_23695 [Terracidiphilus sp.]
MKLHTVFLREGCTLPEQSDLRQVPFCEGWTEANGTLVTQLDFGIRGAGWHFMWIAGSHSSRGLGRTAETATRRALIRSLAKVRDRFNAAEFGSIYITSCLGFQVAKVTVYARQIQKETSLDRAEQSRLQQLPAH